MGERRPRPLVVDTSVAVKFYVVEEGHEDALEILDAADEGRAELIAPSTILAEGFNAIRRQERRGILDAEDARNAWDDLLHAPIYTYAPEDLIERAAELHFESGASIYDALFFALAEESNTVVATADDKLLRRLEGTGHARLSVSLAEAARILDGNS
ncbi:MAG: type II toxin-antitoxin system VapC family toxin [Rubrobacter sp.]|nr:type II toxin-antitoxin system VapC family toxin [Rubrobacter sp.]